MTWQSRLVHWYRKNRRDLPWRRTRDPYRIWVSEVMLQQTTVETVIPYYERFLKRFPTLKSLADADEEEVLKLWSGLGYYSRARNLHRAARVLCGGGGGWRGSGARPRGQYGARVGGTRARTRLPRNAADWQQLPGIGRYTAGAIASIAFDERAPVLDGNVIRVLSRLFGLKIDPKSPQGQKVFWKKAEEILPQKSCGDFNQSLMELGATVCLPERPLCRSCPLRPFCRARREGNPESYPHGRKKVMYQSVQLSAALVKKDGRFLMVRRPDKGLLKGMWEFPMVEGDVKRLDRAFKVSPVRVLSPVRHSVLNRRLTITPYLCKQDKKAGGRFRWIPEGEIPSLATSSMNRKVLRRYRESIG